MYILCAYNSQIAWESTIIVFFLNFFLTKPWNNMINESNYKNIRDTSSSQIENRNMRIDIYLKKK